jgi:hypothetical protein
MGRRRSTGGRVAVIAGAVLLAAAAMVDSACAQDADEALLASLPEGPGKEETFYLCHGCHSFRLVAQQGLSRSRWDKLLDWMVEEQGMAALDGEDRALVLDYLSTHFNEERPR